MNNWITLNIVLWISLMIQLSVSLTPPSEVIVGAQFPMHKTAANIEDGGGRRRRAAFVLALEHINNKNDGFYDDLLPDTTINYAVYDSKRNEGEAVVNAFYMWSNAKAIVAIGPASSGPSKQSQQVFKLPHVNIPQVSYSATSAQLSDASSNPKFMRTPPSDVYQAEIMVSTIKLQGWTKVCILGGLDSYSSAGANAVIEEITKTEGLSILKSVSFDAETISVEPQITQLRNAGCPVIILWAQSADMKTIIKEADKQGKKFTSNYHQV
jgi:ABC-type branched-subunit amino acid transport system substrate-binding protein